VKTTRLRSLGAGRGAGVRCWLAAVAVCAAGLAIAAPASANLVLIGKWGSIGSGIGQFGEALGITVGSSTVYVGDDNRRPNLVQRFDLGGGFIGNWTLPFIPNQIATDETGVVYATAGAGNAYGVQAFTPTGSLLASWNGTGIPGGRVSPDGVAAARGRVYVADGRRVVVFTPSGAYVSQWGTSGSGPGQFGNARRIALDADGNVFVFDAGNSRIEKFDPNGKFITQFGMSNPNGTLNTSSVYGAGGLAVSPDGYLWVAGFYSFRIQKFTLGGQFVAVYQSGTPAVGGVTFRPSDIAVDPAGNMYVNDDTTRILKFSESGTPPPPVLGKAVDVKPVSGHVFIKLPPGTSVSADVAADAGGQLSSAAGASALTSFAPWPQARASATPVKGKGFVSLTTARQIPVGSQIDARAGTLQLLSASTRKRVTFSGTFSGGIFTVVQSKVPQQQGLTTLRILDAAFPGAPTRRQCTTVGKSSDVARAARSLSSHTLQLLRARAHGRFRTRGRYSAATVRGTEWDTSERCDGTLTIVHRGTVVVTDFRRRVNITLTRGHNYLAKAG
jgi:sugar lactone lactonase YvrE